MTHSAKKWIGAVTGVAAATLVSVLAFAQGTAYNMPPAPIAQILDTPPTPSVEVGPTRTTLALYGRANLPAIAELAEGELRLAGYRINPRNNGPANSRIAWLNALSLQDIASGAVRSVQLPPAARFTQPRWSPDGAALAISLDTARGLELWLVDVASAQARRATDALLNATFGEAYHWLPDSSGLIVRLVPASRGAPPKRTQAPAGPVVQETAGRTAPAPTFQDLLRNEVDAASFEYYFTAQLAVVRRKPGVPLEKIGAPGLVQLVEVAPNGRYVLQKRLKRPFSYVVPASLFANEVFVSDFSARTIYRVVDAPLREDVSPQNDATVPGPREAEWRADQPATLVWVEAQDGGDAKRVAAVRDRVLSLTAPFTGTPITLIDLPERYSGVFWGREDVALVFSNWWNTRHQTRHLLNPGRPAESRVLAERNFQDRYNDPGVPVMRRTPQGTRVIHFTADGQGVLMTGNGATRSGEFPFLARLDLVSGKSEKLWQSDSSHYESVVAVLSENAERIVTRRESRTEPANYFVRPVAGGEPRQLTRFKDPAPQFAGVTQRLLTYKRADGVELSGTLYLPAGYDSQRDGTLPLIMWAYPTEFTDAAVAGQVVDTQNRFVRPSGISHLFLLTQGYAVLDDPKMPIVGGKGVEPNDTYIEQLVASAQAAVDAVVAAGVADRGRIAVGGHSYGAFMTANLLAHSDVFRTGIARSGAYNRTLTPFGFQAEQRTYWEAAATYANISPFTYANKINEPILLMHGEADDNTGTYPIQTERFFAALKGLGATARYVVLPLEAHGYRARESVMHTQWEMTRWLDTHLKAARNVATVGEAK
jgi:dipeptidyl aminopeptidase/acylaminoacyl peptidase